MHLCNWKCIYSKVRSHTVDIHEVPAFSFNIFRSRFCTVFIFEQEVKHLANTYACCYDIFEWIILCYYYLLTQNFAFQCEWFIQSRIDLVFQIPIGIVVFLNFAFLIGIMCVLVTKLTSAPGLETQQYYKAAKALLILNPLLGTTYAFTFYCDDNGAYVFECIRAIFLSTQVSGQMRISKNME